MSRLTATTDWHERISVGLSDEQSTTRRRSMQDRSVDTSAQEGIAAPCVSDSGGLPVGGTIVLLELVAWFTRQYNKHVEPLIKAIEKKGIGHQFAEDIAHEVFISLWTEICEKGPMPDNLVSAQLFA